MRAYHRSNHASMILRDGFRDGRGSYGFLEIELVGVFVSDVPLGVNEGAVGDELLVLELADEKEETDYQKHWTGFSRMIPSTTMSFIGSIPVRRDSVVSARPRPQGI